MCRACCRLLCPQSSAGGPREKQVSEPQNEQCLCCVGRAECARTNKARLLGREGVPECWRQLSVDLRCLPQDHAIGLRDSGQECDQGGKRQQRRSHSSRLSSEFDQLQALLPPEQETPKLLVLETPLYMCQPVNKGYPGTQCSRTRYLLSHSLFPILSPQIGQKGVGETQSAILLGMLSSTPLVE